MKKGKLLSSLGVNKLSHDFLQFTTVHLIFMAATAITTTYINTLLMRVCTDVNAAFKYDIIFYAFTAIGMLLATPIMKKFTNKTILTIGAVFYMLVYGLTLVFVAHLDSIYGIISALHGIGCGFYWIEVSRATVSYTTDDTREVAMSYMGVLVGAVGLVVPLITGIVIDITAGLYGYFIVFGICFLLCLLTILYVAKLRPLPPKNKKTKLLYTLKLSNSNPLWANIMWSQLFIGIRDGSFGIFLSVLLFELVKSESVIGINSFLVGIIGIFANFVIGKVMRPNNRMKYMLISTTVMAVLTALLFIKLDAVNILLLSVVGSFLGSFMLTPATTTLYTFLDEVKEAKNLEGEIFSIVDCYKNIGRILGILIIMLVPKTDFYYVIALMILSASQYITYIFTKLALKSIKKESLNVVR